ncbi:MAG: FAD:protein FMN transferase, partial [Opitutaceae bacterium]
MGTVVSIRVVGSAANSPLDPALVAAVSRAANWFETVERACSRFDPESELRQIARESTEPVPISPILFQAVQFAVRVAEETGGAFDPTVGHRLAARGFNRHYQSGAVSCPPMAEDPGASYRDVQLDEENQTIAFARPVGLDLGAVAKGLAVDLAVKELAPFQNFCVDAGGDLYVGGSNAEGEAWSVGIRHPRDASAMIRTLRLSDAAVCTSGDYERKGNDNDGHHLIDPRTGKTALSAV